MTRQLGRLEKVVQQGLSRTWQLERLKKVRKLVGQAYWWCKGGLGLVEPKLPNNSFETLQRYMTRQLGRLE